MPGCPSTRLTTHANRSVSHSRATTLASPSATPTRSGAMLASPMNTMIAAIGPRRLT